MSVLFAILLIFFYLFYEILPLFRSASVQPVGSYSIAKLGEVGPPLYLAVEEQNEIAMRLDRGGRIVFFHTANGEPIQTVNLPMPAGVKFSSFALESEQSQIIGVRSQQWLGAAAGATITPCTTARMVAR